MVSSRFTVSSGLSPTKINLKGVLHPSQKIICFTLSQNYQKYFLKKIMYASHSKLSKELKNDIQIEAGQAVLDILISLADKKFQCHF